VFGRHVKIEIPFEPSQQMEPENLGQEPETRIEQQLRFLVEADKLKNVLRRTTLTDRSRQENSAEHSWHLVLTAMVLEEYASTPVSMAKVLRMLAVHDVVEIDAGDTFAYDATGNATKEDRERRAADRIFGLLPTDLGKELRRLWEEFEETITPEARFAHAVDRIQPFLQNRETRGGTWQTHGLSKEEILARMDPVRTALPQLWPTVLAAVDDFFAKPST
jgi:putative hydrolase of HD superfamily